MNVETDMARLERRAKMFKLWASAAWFLAFLAFTLGYGLMPGPNLRAFAFSDVHIHPQIADYLASLGVKAETSRDTFVLGFSIRTLSTVLTMARFVCGIMAIASLLRLRLRQLLLWGLACFLIGYPLQGLESGHGYLTAQRTELGVQNPLSAPTAPLVKESFSDIAGTAWQQSFDEERRKTAEHRRALGERIQALFDAPEPGSTPERVALLQYTAAQLAYLKGDPAQVSQRLNRVKADGFLHSGASDWRWRVMTAYTAAHGYPPAANSYRPIYGIELSGMRIIAQAFVGLAGLLAVLAIILVQLARAMAGRTKRIKSLLEQLTPTRGGPDGANAFGRAVPNPGAS